MLWPLVGTYSKQLQSRVPLTPSSLSKLWSRIQALVKDSTAMNNMRAT